MPIGAFHFDSERDAGCIARKRDCPRSQPSPPINKGLIRSRLFFPHTFQPTAASVSSCLRPGRAERGVMPARGQPCNGPTAAVLRIAGMTTADNKLQPAGRCIFRRLAACHRLYGGHTGSQSEGQFARACQHVPARDSQGFSIFPIESLSGLPARNQLHANHVCTPRPLARSLAAAVKFALKPACRRRKPDQSPSPSGRRHRA